MEYDVAPNKFLSGRRCPYCSINRSKAEEIIYDEFLKNGFLDKDIVRQKTFPDLMDKNFLRYDFYIEKFNLLLEFDGEQHFVPFRRSDGKEKLDDTRRHDAMKDEYAKNHGFNIIRIPYTRFDSLEEEVLAICSKFKTP